jgi:hypothetical protein
VAVTASAVASVPVVEVLGETVTRPGGTSSSGLLLFTGTGLKGLLTTAAWLLGLGAVAILTGRRLASRATRRAAIR